MMRTALATMLLLGLGLPTSGCDATVINSEPFVRYDLAGAGSDGGTGFIPGKPLVGMLIDRLGRPAINTALTNPFNLVTGSTTAMVKNQYNAAVPGNWGSYAARPYIAENLAIFDGFDSNCGNQLLAGAAGANRYIQMANLLADDRLYLNANSGTCTKYLALEQGVQGDCGGRHPTMVVMDVTYNLLIAGSLTAGWTNGVTADLDGGIAANAPFPFLLAPK